MGTRADFYVGRGVNAEWLGSIGWDGYPDGIDSSVLQAKTADEFREALNAFAAKRDDWTRPDEGWPWPWEDSNTTDYAYAFDEGHVWGSNFGSAWFDATQEPPDEDNYWDDAVVSFPNMAERMNVTLGKRSGTIIVGG